MLRKILGVVTAVAAGLVVVGVAWASSDAGSSTTSSSFVATSVNSESSSTTAGGSTSSIARDSTSTSLGGSTSTSIGSGTTSTSLGSSTSTTIGSSSSTSTTINNTTSTSFDDSDIPVPDGTYHYQVATAGSVTIQVDSGAMSLASVNTNAGWKYTVEKNHSDDIEIGFEKGDAEASIRVKADHGKLDVEIESKSG